jgi:Flp pilus assembly protein TadD
MEPGSALAVPQDYKPTKADELNHMGALLFNKGQLEPARFHFLAALQLDPNHAMALQNLGAVLRNMGHYEAAASVARRSVRLSPENPFCQSNLGVSLLSLKDYDACLATLRRVAKALPDSGPSHHNLGLVLYMLGRFEEALASFDRAKGLQADNPVWESDRALTLLALGRLDEGLAAYEVRWKLLAKSPIWDLGLPEWQGEPLIGKSILVHHEQGFGDSLMLVRFVDSLVARRKATIVLAVPNELVRLFDFSFGGSVEVVPLLSDTLAKRQFDYHTPMLSMMRHLGIAHPDHISSYPYIVPPPDEDEIVTRLPKSALRIGIVWASGNHGMASMDRRRLVAVTKFLPFTELPGVSVISLQKGDEAQDIRRFGLEGLIYDASPRLEDFAATAILIEALDLVVTVDSAVAHLAGAMDVPTIMLSPYSRCWRWWNANQASGLPWYDNMVVLSQAQDGSWDNAVADALEHAVDMLGVMR